jgi:hypothetical protein
MLSPWAGRAGRRGTRRRQQGSNLPIPGVQNLHHRLSRKIFSKVGVFSEAEKSAFTDHKNTTTSPRKNHQNTIKKHPFFSKPPYKNTVQSRQKNRGFGKRKMVEAVGVEPTSERASNRERSCFFQFIFVSSSPLRTDKDAATTSLINLIRPAQTEQGRPAYCATIGTGP